MAHNVLVTQLSQLQKYQEKGAVYFYSWVHRTEHKWRTSWDWRSAAVHRHCTPTHSACRVPSLSWHWLMPAGTHSVTAASCTPLSHCPQAVMQLRPLPALALHIKISVSTEHQQHPLVLHCNVNNVSENHNKLQTDLATTGHCIHLSVTQYCEGI